MSDVWAYISRSTLKREAASFLMLCYMIFTAYLVYGSPRDPVMAKQMWDALLLPVFTTFIGAFGSDFVAKQTNWGGPPANTETTVKTELTDTTATVTTSSEPTDQKP